MTSILIPSEYFSLEIHAIPTILKNIPDIRVILHEDEKQIYAKALVDKRRNSLIAGRWCAKLAYQKWSGDHRNMSQISIGYSMSGSPVILEPQANPPDLSIAHCETHAAAICFPRTWMCGIDLENVSAQGLELVSNYLTTTEKNTLLKTTDHPILALLWTQKEALSKALRTGFKLPFELFEIEAINWQKESAFAVVSFHHFPDLKGVFLQQEDLAISIVLPKEREFLEKTIRF